MVAWWGWDTRVEEASCLAAWCLGSCCSNQSLYRLTRSAEYRWRNVSRDHWWQQNLLRDVRMPRDRYTL